MDKQSFIARYGPWAVVTGASSGIGLAIASRLAEFGFGLVLVARREPQLQQLAQGLTNRLGTFSRVLAADLSAPSSLDGIASATSDIDVGLLVAAAGYGSSGAFIDSDIAEEVRMIQVNCGAVAQMTHAFARRFVERKRGGIILMSSIVAFQGVPRAANYAATKAYIQSLAEGLHAELKPHGVDVLASAPGPVRSGFESRAGMTMGRAQSPEEVARGTLNALGHRGTVRPGFLAKALEASLTPLPRWGRVSIMARIMEGMTRG